MMCDRKNTNELTKWLGLGETVVEVVNRNGLRWIEKEENELVKRVSDLEVDGIRGKGRPKISLKAMMKKEISKYGPNGVGARDKKTRREGVGS